MVSSGLINFETRYALKPAKPLLNPLNSFCQLYFSLYLIPHKLLNLNMLKRQTSNETWRREKISISQFATPVLRTTPLSCSRGMPAEWEGIPLLSDENCSKKKRCSLEIQIFVFIEIDPPPYRGEVWRFPEPRGTIDHYQIKFVEGGSRQRHRTHPRDGEGKAQEQMGERNGKGTVDILEFPNLLFRHSGRSVCRARPWDLARERLLLIYQKTRFRRLLLLCRAAKTTKGRATANDGNRTTGSDLRWKPFKRKEFLA